MEIKLFNKDNYKVSDLHFKDLKGGIIIGKEKVYDLESISKEEKIKMMDDFSDGIASYMLNIIKAFEREKDRLAKTIYGDIKDNSLKAWLKKIDTRHLVYREDYQRNLQEYWMFGREIKKLSLECPTTSYGYSLLYSGGDIVNQWFHDFIVQMKASEEKWFLENDSVMIKKSKLIQLGKQYGVFDSKDLNDIVWNRKDVKEEKIDKYLKIYAELEKYYKELGKKVNDIE